jgi:hypothetical protein
VRLYFGEVVCCDLGMTTRPRRPARLPILVAASVLVAIALGCGGSSDADDTSSGSTSAASEGDATQGPDDGGDDSPADSSGGGLTGPGDDGDDDGGDDGSGPTDDSTGAPPPGDVELPPPDAGLDYQLGGAYPPPRGVGVVSRDRNDPPADGLYNLCYVNGFQAQPDEEAFWLEEHPDLVLRDAEGNPVIDADWDEMLLDVGTPAKREALAVIVGGWITECGADGYDAVEIDNLDSYSRSQGLLASDHAVASMALLSVAAHEAGLAIAQKNSTELVPQRLMMGTDFVVAEECNAYSECDDYIAEYGEAVLMIEYSVSDFDTGCAEYPGWSIVLRDLDLTTPGRGGYVYDGC